MIKILGQFFRFGCVGTVGFLVDAGLLFLLVSAGIDPLLARVLSFPTAVTVTWQLNRAWTFALPRETAQQGQLYTRYFLVQGGGAMCNYAAYVVALGATGTTPGGAVAALAVGSVVGMVINFAGARFLVFSQS